MKDSKLSKRAIIKSRQVSERTSKLESENKVIGGNVYIQTTRPINPQVGDIWYDISQYITT